MNSAAIPTKFDSPVPQLQSSPPPAPGAFVPTVASQIHAVVAHAGGIVTAGVWSNYKTMGSCFLVRRYTPEGEPDFAFGYGGTVLTRFGDSPHSLAFCAHVQADGRILVAGATYAARSYTQEIGAMARYNADGTLDESFGDGGKVTWAIGENTGAYSIVEQPDGRLVVGCQTRLASGFSSAITRFSPDGGPDLSFGVPSANATVSLAQHPNGVAGLTKLVVVPSGKILAIGVDSATWSKPALTQFHPHGLLDGEFGSAGTAFVSVTRKTGAYVSPNDSVALPDGSILVAGTVATTESSNLFLAKVQPGGRKDRTFGASRTGVVAVTKGKHMTQANCLALQHDGTVLVAGRRDQALAVLRYNPNGILDETFGTTGISSIQMDRFAVGFGMALLDENRVVVAGFSQLPNGVRREALATFAY